MTRETALPLSAEEEQTTRMVIAARRAHPVDGDAFTLRLLATLDAARTPGEAGLRTALDEAARDAHALTVRGLKASTCEGPFETCPSPYCTRFRAALFQPAALHDEWCDGSGSSAGSACCSLAAQPRQEAPSD